MKSKCTLLFTYLLLLINIGCSSSSSSDPITATPIPGTLFVNLVDFSIGTNTTGNFYNSLIIQNGTTINKVFNILNKNSTNQSNTESIIVNINYPATQSNINGTYSIMNGSSNINNSFTCILNSPNGGFGGNYTYASGTITVTDNGSDNYKIIFNNVILKKTSDVTVTKSITGYIQTTFKV